MIRVKVIEEFTLNDYNKLQNIKRAKNDVAGRLFVNDEFECDNEMAEYLTGKNALNKKVVDIIEVKIDKKETVEKKETKKDTKKKKK